MSAHVSPYHSYLYGFIHTIPTWFSLDKGKQIFYTVYKLILYL